MNPLLLVDSYKVNHTRMYPDGMNLLYSNFTPRKSRIDGVESVVFFGLQHFMKEYLVKQFNEEFFWKDWPQIGFEYTRHNQIDIDHIQELHELGYLPIKIKALKEGELCPIGVPCLTIVNTHPKFGWLVNYLETLISCTLWQPITSATIANEYRKLLNGYAKETTGSTDGVQWQGHDFSMRGMSSVESAILSSMGHLTSFTGTDTIPALYQLEKSYNASRLIGASVPATEHSVMCMGEKESEVETFKRLLDLYPTGILSVVSDTWDLWKVLTEYLPAIKDQVLSRDGKLVIRPDSGDPVDIICGNSLPLDGDIDVKNVNDMFSKSKFFHKNTAYYKINGAYADWLDKMAEYEHISATPCSKGVIELLWDTFGGAVNEQGYKVLDTHIGAIYGDSITIDRAKKICERLKAKGFASTNIVFGIGSYTYQYNTRDTFGFAMKATYGEVNGIGREIFKDPITDDGTKKSKKGLLAVFKSDKGLFVQDQCTVDMEQIGELEVVFQDGKLIKEFILDEIRETIKSH